MSAEYREHVADGTPCRCGPRVQQRCPQCLGDGCDLCDEVGWVPPYGDTADVPTLVIHNDADEGDG